MAWLPYTCMFMPNTILIMCTFNTNKNFVLMINVDLMRACIAIPRIYAGILDHNQGFNFLKSWYSSLRYRQWKKRKFTE